MIHGVLQDSQDLMSFDELMYDVIKFIRSDMVKNNSKEVQFAAMDIGCGYHSYTRSIRQLWSLKVCMLHVVNCLNSFILICGDHIHS